VKITCGIFLYNIENSKFLIGHATRSKNFWSIPKGLKDEGESSFEAATREFSEETGMDFNEINVLSVHNLPAVKYRKQNKVLESFLVISDTKIDERSLKCKSLVNEQYPEIDRFEWIGLEGLKAKAHESQASLAELIEQILKKNLT
jgi:8-oxo-dGTP pyrophosphatase MutT (NUDIX family)